MELAVLLPILVPRGPPPPGSAACIPGEARTSSALLPPRGWRRGRGPPPGLGSGSGVGQRRLGQDFATGAKRPSGRPPGREGTRGAEQTGGEAEGAGEAGPARPPALAAPRARQPEPGGPAPPGEGRALPDVQGPRGKERPGPRLGTGPCRARGASGRLPGFGPDPAAGEREARGGPGRAACGRLRTAEAPKTTLSRASRERV